jgi:hypothetical protein
VRALAAALLAAVVVVPAAAAHPRAKGYARGFHSKVLSVRPELAGLAVSVVDGDDRLRIANDSGTDLLVLGYDGEPYLRIGPAGVHRNERSPASYLNRDRFARISVPLTADPGAKPVWKRVSARPAWQWHDHRIQWMGLGPPTQVREKPDQTHRIFDWSVPGRLGDQRLTVTGRLDYVPPAESGVSSVLIVLIAVTTTAALLGFGLLMLRLRRGEETAPQAG